ncbi:hypothetical protein [Shewanella sp.]|uniref:hypothetical protein n=1 Tax=Shewanella sp. TaxID=50422 RepID=UPI004048C4D2
MDNKPVTQDDLKQLKQDLIGMIEVLSGRIHTYTIANTKAIEELEKNLKGK